ncbi:ribonuclease J [Phytohalomonas tamaricis]|uniref:ribonuclease J n=1 Tax=Phytohalomonas tamaricis TaxID=2081032 RepID=UPI000D0B5D69|nr:ribonuclease J [Phytohalomonas tamaricis]
MNLTLYGFEGQWIAVDCGMQIRQDLPDAPLQIPDVESLAAYGIRPEAIVLTHGHEDHLGALAWIWPRWGCPIWASPLAAGLLRHKFSDLGLRTDAINIFTPGNTFELSPFCVRTLPVPHSIPESCALLITADTHRILHTGDWKLDETPLIGSPLNKAAFQSLGAVDLLVGDSTNAPQPGHSRSEGVVALALEQHLHQCQGRVVISCFASNLSRIQAIGRAAERNGRRVVLLGRAMTRMVQVARSLGYLEDFPNLVPLRDAGYLPRHEVLVIATGSQGEPRAALSRLAHNTHPDIELQAGDSVIFSSKAIPGNEEAIKRLQNAFKYLGLDVYEEKQHPELHASGHPAQEELKALYQWVKPRCLIPVHGERLHQEAHQQLAQSMDIEVPLIPSDGQWLKWNGHELHVKEILELKPRLISQRQKNNTHRRVTRNSIALLIPVVHDRKHWQRVGRLILDGDIVEKIDEQVLAEWLDNNLELLEAQTIDELAAHLKPLLTQWLLDHMLSPMHIEIELAQV